MRRHPSGREIADRIWANIGRVTGTIARRDGDTLVVNGGDGGNRQVLVIAERNARRIQVRFPRLEPGYLIDLIGVRHDGYLEGLVPATSSRPTARIACRHPPWSAVTCRARSAVPRSGTSRGTARRPDRYRLSGHRPPNAAAPGIRPARRVGLRQTPYLSVGSRLRVRNDCTGLSLEVPVIGPAPVARLFCDRSVVCGPSPRGRIADLTVAGFVELGGELDEGNFNATIEIEG